PRIFNLNIEYKLTSDRDLYYGVSNSSKSFDKITTIPKDTVVLLLHKVTNPEGFSLADYYQIEVSTSAGKIRGYAFEREIMDWYNPLKNFDQVKNNSLAVTYKNNIYYSAFGKYVPNLIGANWHLDSEFTLQKINIDWIAGFKNMIFSNDFNDDAYQKLQKPYLLNVNTKVSSQLGDSVAKQKMDNLANIFSLADAFLAGANKTFSMDIQLQSYQNERKIVILTGNPIEEPLAGKKNVYLSDLILQQRGNGVFFEKENLADEAIRSMFPQLNGTDKYSMIMNFSNDFKDNPYGFEIIIDKNQNVYASPIIHPGTTFNIYYQGKVVLDAAMALGSSYFQPDSSNEILQLLKSNGFSF
ncbi:MAG: hypothetical protein FWC47_12780, partial [Oscillospiraceae bacterium]|nr:hypothetical protein [Oscillospiraceae bacterium]